MKTFLTVCFILLVGGVISGLLEAQPPVEAARQPTLAPPRIETIHPGPYSPTNPVDDFLRRNPLVRVRKVAVLPHSNSRYYQMLLFVEGQSDRAIIPYYLPQGQFIDLYPAYLPMEGEVWRTGAYYSGRQQRVMLRSLWSKVGQDPGTAMPGEGRAPAGGLTFGADAPNDDDTPPELTPESFMEPGSE